MLQATLLAMPQLAQGLRTRCAPLLAGLAAVGLVVAIGVATRLLDFQGFASVTPEWRMDASSRFLRFALVGVVGFVVDAGVLQALITLAGWGPIAARAVAVPVARVRDLVLNRTVTFPRSQGGPALRSLAALHRGQCGGSQRELPRLHRTGIHLERDGRATHRAAGDASIVALIVNYLGSKHFAFRQP